jgi:hypothetical protein
MNAAATTACRELEPANRVLRTRPGAAAVNGNGVPPQAASSGTGQSMAAAMAR